MSLAELSFRGRSLALRRAGEADFPAILALLEDAEDWMGEEGPWERGHHRSLEGPLRAWIADHEWVLAEAEDELAAMVLLMREDPRWAGFSGAAVYVHKLVGRRCESWRGVGRALLDWVEERERGLSGRVRLDTSVAAPGLLRFYEAAGYHARGEIDEAPWRLRLYEKLVKSSEERDVNIYGPFKTQDDIDLEYNMREAIKDETPYADIYVNESARARKELRCELDVPYGPTLDEHLDIFYGAERGAPVFVFIHGGYWRALSSKEFSLVALGPASKGILTLVTNYSLCPKVTIDEITRQNRAAIAWAYRNAAKYGGDPERIYVAGHSAGGQQTAMMLSTDWAGEYGLPADVIKGGIAVSGVHDLRPLPYTYLAPRLQLSHETMRRQNTLLNVPESSPPMIVTVGAEETGEFVRNSRKMFENWKAAGRDVRWLEQPGKNHYTAIEGFYKLDDPLGAAFLEMVGA